MEIIFIIVIVSIIIVYQIISRVKNSKMLSTIKKEIKNTQLNRLKENSYMDYTQFYGEESLTDKEFVKKMKIIYTQIITEKEEDIRQVAELAGCTYTECILKIRYLKQIKKIPTEYFIDEANGLVNKCSKEDQELLKKYRPYIYRSQLQISDIAARLPHTPGKTYQEIKNQVLEELSHLDDQDLIDGIILNKVDGTITYYNNKSHKNKKDKITVNCQNCGAPNQLNRSGKAWCSYCGTIVEDKGE